MSKQYNNFFYGNEKTNNFFRCLFHTPLLNAERETYNFKRKVSLFLTEMKKPLYLNFSQ
jgi:hypothetical protein